MLKAKSTSTNKMSTGIAIADHAKTFTVTSNILDGHRHALFQNPISLQESVYSKYDDIETHFIIDSISLNTILLCFPCFR